MKNQNFDFIKDKFDNSGVNAPGSLNEEAVLAQLENSQPVEVVPPKKSKRKLVAGVSAAAAIAVVTAGAITFTGLFNSPLPQKGGKVLFRESAGLRAFSDRAEIQSTMNEVLKLNKIQDSNYYTEDYYEYGNDVKFFNSDSATGASSSHNATYTQSVGVDEADTVKTDGKYIFALHNDYPRVEIAVFSADGENSKQVAAISDWDGENVSAFIDFFLYDGKLIAIWNDYLYQSELTSALEKGAMSEQDAALCMGSTLTAMTNVTVYDVSNLADIRAVDSFSQSGSYVSSRMIGGTLYLVTNQRFTNEYSFPITMRGKAATEDSAAAVPSDSIFSVETPVNNSFLVVSAVDTVSGTQTANTKAIIGSANIIYCNRQNLYITALEYSPERYVNMLNNSLNVAEDNAETSSAENNGVAANRFVEPEQTQIVKVSLEKDLTFAATGRVEGSVNNQYAMDEYQGKLRVATTSYNEKYENINNLFILDENLKQIGAVTGFAENEMIQAVRYINETAYVITFRETDPLFVIDASDPTNPQIKGQVKITGFSTLLVPVDENTLLGIGYHREFEGEAPFDPNLDNALKIVTFDVTDKSSPKVLDSKIFAHYFSEVQYNPKALLVNFERGDYAIPTQYFNDGEWKDGEYHDSEPAETKSGMIHFRVDNGKINILDNYTSKVFTGDDPVDRCVYVGDYIYLIGAHYAKDGSGKSTIGIEAVKYH